MNELPSHFNDASSLLSDHGFMTSDVWYHGTSSVLVDSILNNGLIRSGDKAIKEATKNTMATIGNAYTESTEPVFLTQSKALAYYWATQTVRDRSVRFEGEQTPVVIEVTLPCHLNDKVKPDVGAASLLMIKEGEAFMAYVAKLYQDCGVKMLDIDLMKADRMEYLSKLGMAYINQDIDSQYLSRVTD